MDSQELENLRRAQRAKRVIQNTCNYDILSNHKYADLFYYDPLDRRKEHESSDMVTKLLYLGEDKIQRDSALPEVDVIETAFGFLLNGAASRGRVGR